MNTIIEAGLESGSVASGNNGQRRSGGQGRRELQNTETQYRTRAIERQIAGVFEEIQAYLAHKSRRGGLVETFGTCFEPKRA